MEFLFTMLLLATFFTIGLKAQGYTKRVRLALILASAFTPIWFYIVWQG